MKLSFAFAVLATTITANAQADPSINTPSGVTQCLPTRLTFNGSSPPFSITIHRGGAVDSAALITFPATSGEDGITWIANQPAGTSLTLVIRDSMGRTNPSATFTVAPGADSSCLNGGASTIVSSSAAADMSSIASVAPTTPAVSSAQASSFIASAASSAAAVSSARDSSSITTMLRGSVSSPAPAASASTSLNAATKAKPLGLTGLVGLVGVVALL